MKLGRFARTVAKAKGKTTTKGKGNDKGNGKDKCKDNDEMFEGEGRRQDSLWGSALFENGNIRLEGLAGEADIILLAPQNQQHQRRDRNENLESANDAHMVAVAELVDELVNDVAVDEFADVVAELVDEL
jgi:hypothetical protein